MQKSCKAINLNYFKINPKAIISYGGKVSSSSLLSRTFTCLFSLIQFQLLFTIIISLQQPCPGPAQDPRTEQCAVYDRRPFRGRFFTWVPYVDGKYINYDLFLLSIFQVLFFSNINYFIIQKYLTLMLLPKLLWCYPNPRTGLLSVDFYSLGITKLTWMELLTKKVNTFDFYKVA